MAFVLWLLMALIPFALGKCALRILYGNQPTQEMGPADAMLVGGMIVIGLAEVAHLTGCLLGRSFSDCVVLFAGAVKVCLAIAVIGELLVLKREGHGQWLKSRWQQRKKSGLIYIAFGAIVLIQMLTIALGQEIYFGGDMTLETVNSFLAEDAVYRVNPMTGQPYTLGMPLRLKVLCLPTLYGALCQISGLSAETVVLSVVPLYVLAGSYLAYITVAGYLFEKDKLKKGAFLILIALLFWAGDYMPAMEGFGVMHNGFRGVAIRGAVLIPYTVGLMLRKKYRLVVLCILAEACMVWTFYGMGACVAVAAGMLCVAWGMKRMTKTGAGKEDEVCGNS